MCVVGFGFRWNARLDDQYIAKYAVDYYFFLDYTIYILDLGNINLTSFFLKIFVIDSSLQSK